MTSQPSGIRPFDHIWEKVIQSVSKTVLEKSDQYFVRCCELQLRSADEWRNGLYEAYQFLREQLKDICYGQIGRAHV